MVLIFLLIQQSTVQTYIAQKAAAYLSEKLHTRVDIGSVEIRFFKRAVINDIYIEDLHKDTLLYSKRIMVGVSDIDLDKHNIQLGDIVLLNTRSKLIKYKGEHGLNLQFIIDAFQSKDTTRSAGKPWNLSIGSVSLVNTDFNYRSERDTLETTGINYFDLETRSVNGKIDDIRFVKDTILANIIYLSATEKSGFVLKELSSYVKLSPVELKLDQLKIKTPESTIATDLKFSYSRYDDYNHFIDKVKFLAEFDRSHLELSDIAYFAPDLHGIYRNLTISGKVSGKVSDIKGKKMEITTGNSTLFKGDVTMTGLPKIDETLIYLNVERLTTDYRDLLRIPIPPFSKRQYLTVPSSIAKLGIMKFKGTFTGLYTDFYAYGDFSTALGNLSSDISVKKDQQTGQPVYEGKLRSKDFNFGKFFNAPLVGNATGSVNIKGSGFSLNDLNASLDGKINSIDFNHYSYNNVELSGQIAKKIFKGKLNVQDDNIDFDFIGKVDLTGKLPNLDFVTTLNHANLNALNFGSADKSSEISTQVLINVTGDNIDNMSGFMNFDNTIYKQNGVSYKLSVFNLTSEESNGMKSLELFSDVVDARLKGKFKLLDLPKTIRSVMSNYLPSYFPAKQKMQAAPSQQFDFSIQFRKPDVATNLFVPALHIAPKTKIQGKFDSEKQQISFDGNSESIVYGIANFQNWEVHASSEQQLKLTTSCERLVLTDSIALEKFAFVSMVKNDSVHFDMNWENKAAHVSNGDIEALLVVNGVNKLNFKILPSRLTIADSVWNVDKSNEIRVDSSYVLVRNLEFEHGNQSLGLDGIVSENKKDQLNLLLTNFNLSNLDGLTKPAGLSFTGTINGKSEVTDLYHDFIFSSDNHFSALALNNNLIGDGDVASIWDQQKEALYLHGNFTQGSIPNILFSGYYYPKKDEESLDMEMSLQSIQMDLFEPFVKEYCSDFKGMFSGNVNVKGTPKQPKLTGLLNVNARKVTVDYLNTTYKFNHDISIEENSFGVENMVVYDVNNNKAIVTGKVYHNYFKDFQLDIDIRVNKFMCLNTTEANNPLYYGKAYASGIVNIFGFTDNILLDANLKTEKVTYGDKSTGIGVASNTEITRFYLPLSNTAEVAENNFITFVKKDSSLKLQDDYKVKLGGITLNFDLEVTPDAEVQLIFDQKVGDVIKAKGNGDLKLAISQAGDFKMYGDYVIENGDYLFTLQNIINKKFDVEKGGTIKWSGIPYKADMNLSAIYKPRASLKPFFPEDSTGIYKKRTPVDLKLLMTGDLLSPEINFEIGLPTVDATTRQTVLSYVNNDAEINRQVFSLLILNSFVTPYQLTNSGVGPTVGSALGANTSELLSNQLSNMLSKISKDFDVGVNYRPGDAISKDELELALSTQLFDDRLTIDGNVSNNTNSQNTSNIVGDVTAEYKLIENGKLRIKAFNKANDNSNQLYSSGNYIQGVGIFYREEFDTIGELYKRFLTAFKTRKTKTVEQENDPSDAPPSN